MRTPSRNPFRHPEQAADQTADQTTGQTMEPVERVERTEKPWGHEELFAILEGRYVGKVLTILAGRSLSLQHHREKDETIAVQSGQISLEYGPEIGRLQTVTLDPGDRLLIRAMVVHRMTAIVDSRVLEASTARPGWRNDVVRLEDRYGRVGTSQP